MFLGKQTAILRDVKNPQNPDEAKDRVLLLSGLRSNCSQNYQRRRSVSSPWHPMSTSWLFKEFATIRTERDPRLKAHRTHDARHNFCSRFAANDWSVPQMMTLSGHEDVRSLNTLAWAQSSKDWLAPDVRRSIVGQASASSISMAPIAMTNRRALCRRGVLKS